MRVGRQQGIAQGPVEVRHPRFFGRRAVRGGELLDANGFVIWRLGLHWMKICGSAAEGNDTD
jgi:hypothetical protein